MLRRLFQMAVLPLSFPLLLYFGGVGGCGGGGGDTGTGGGSTTTGDSGGGDEGGEEETTGSSDDGADGDDTETAEPATIENLDGAFFLCSGSKDDGDTCERSVFSSFQRSFFSMTRQGETLQVCDEDLCQTGTLLDAVLSLSADFTSYLPVSYSVAGSSETQTGYCRVQVSDASYEMTFEAMDHFTVASAGTVTDDSSGSDFCTGVMSFYFPNNSCSHQYTLECHRLAEGKGLTADEIQQLYADKETIWEEGMSFAPTSPTGTSFTVFATILVTVDLSALGSLPPTAMLQVQALSCSTCGPSSTSIVQIASLNGWLTPTSAVAVGSAGTYYLRAFIDLDDDYTLDAGEVSGTLNAASGEILPVTVSVQDQTITPSPGTITLSNP